MFNKGLMLINHVAVFILGSCEDLILKQNCLFIKYYLDNSCKYEEILIGEENRKVDLRTEKMLYENGLKPAISYFK